MGVILAVREKNNEDATETAWTMLKTTSMNNVEFYGIASSRSIQTTEKLQQLGALRLGSSTIIGCAFTKILEEDRPQPLRTKDATVAFDGRTYTTGTQRVDAQDFAQQLPEKNKECAALKFIREAEGDFAFAIAEPERLVIGRDALGVRPLYYGENKVFAAVASERKTLWNVKIECAHSFPPGNVAIVNELGFEFHLAKRLTHSRPKQHSMKMAAQRLRILLEQAVKERLRPLKEVAVAFSGGLDSSIIALLSKNSKTKVQLVHVSLEDQFETEQARVAADQLKLPIQVRTYNEEDVSRTLPAVLRAIEEPDPVKASIGIPIYWASEQAAKMNLRVMLAGQGGDELFAGYKRYVDQFVNEGSEAATATVFNDIIRMHENNLERDFKICNSLGVELRLPFAAWQIVKFAVDLPVELKIQPFDDTLRKLVLRQAALNLRLPQSIANRPKKAVQYATGVNSVLKELAKKNGLTVKKYVQKTFRIAMKGMIPHA
jgi:asparagine synthase (glutamine-hydrolysing)